MNLANLYYRNRILIFDPGGAWKRITGEGLTRRNVIMDYLLPMSVLVAICAFLGNLFGGNVRDSSSFSYILINAVFSFLVVFLSVYLSGWLITEVASAFNPDTGPDSIFNLVIYSHAPFFIGLAFIKIFPQLLFVAAIGFYSFYLFWTGIGKLTRINPENRLAFFLASGLIMLMTYTFLTIIFNSVYDVVIEQFVTFGTR